jgi:hypothetical protein
MSPAFFPAPLIENETMSTRKKGSTWREKMIEETTPLSAEELGKLSEP